MKDNKTRTHAEEVIAEPFVINNPEAAKRLLDALENPPEPNKNLKALRTERMIIVEFLCPMCGEFHYLRNIPENKYDRFIRRRENNEAVQDIFSELSKTDREKFLTGYCDECQKKIFRIPDEGEV